jgi:hypothetical protein
MPCKPNGESFFNKKIKRDRLKLKPTMALAGQRARINKFEGRYSENSAKFAAGRPNLKAAPLASFSKIKT